MSAQDRELLELAAKALCFKVRWHEESIYGPTMEVMEDDAGGAPWNPLHDDGDALRVSTFLQMKISHRTVNVDVSVGDKSCSEHVLTYKDRDEAMRRAITRCAAVVGLGIPDEPAEKGGA